MEFESFRARRRGGRGEDLQFIPAEDAGNVEELLVYRIERGSLREMEGFDDGEHYVANFMVGENPGLLRLLIMFGEGAANAVYFMITTRAGLLGQAPEEFHSMVGAITPEAKAEFLRHARAPPPARAARPPGARAPANPVNLDPAALPKVKIPRGQESMISFAEIPDGAVMVDFHNERDQFHRYFTREVFDQLPRRISPATNRPIAPGDITYYVAELDETMQAHPVNGGRRRKGRKGRKTYRKRRFHTRRA